MTVVLKWKISPNTVSLLFHDLNRTHLEILHSTPQVPECVNYFLKFCSNPGFLRVHWSFGGKFTEL